MVNKLSSERGAIRRDSKAILSLLELNRTPPDIFFEYL